MPIRNIYQTQPDKYVRFTRHGKDMEGEFFKYNWCGDEVSPQAGYIRPFDRFLRQCLVDNMQAAHRVDLQNYIRDVDLIECDSYVTHPHIQRPSQALIESFSFVGKDELTTNKKDIDDCRADILYRQYLYAKASKEPNELLSILLDAYREQITPPYEPLRYKRTWLQKHVLSVISILMVLVALLIMA